IHQFILPRSHATIYSVSLVAVMVSNFVLIPQLRIPNSSDFSFAEHTQLCNRILELSFNILKLPDTIRAESTMLASFRHSKRLLCLQAPLSGRLSQTISSSCR